MIKARGTKSDGTPIILLGLSERNLELLRQGRPISFDCAKDLGLQLSILVVYGKTEDAIRSELVSSGIKFESETDARPRNKRG